MVHTVLCMFNFNKRKNMKFVKLTIVAAALLSLSACMGIRGYHGSQKVCENQSFLGISIIEVLSPCK